MPQPDRSLSTSQSTAIIATLSVLCTGWPAAGADTPVYRLPPTVVSASRLPAPLSAPTRDVLVIDRDEIAARAPASIADLLGSLPGFDARTRGPWGVQTDLELDGATFSQLVLLVDGVRVNDPQTGHHNLDLSLAPEDLERVEVVYGAGSAVHGPDALGGVVNLVSRADVASSVSVGTRWGNSLDAGADGVATDAALRTGWHGDWGAAWVSLGKRRSDGYRQGTGFDEDRVHAHARLPLAGGALSLAGGVQDKAFGARDFYAPYPSHEWTTAQTLSAAFERGALTVRAYGRRHRDRFVLIADDPGFYDNRHRSLQTGVEAHTGAAVAGGRLVIGGETVREAITSNNLGAHSRLRGALFGEYGRLWADLWHLSAGLRVDRHEGFGWEVSPSLGVARTMARGRVFASLAHAYRAPSFTETWYSDPANVGDPDLEPEQAWQAEAGAAAAVANGQLEGTVFARRERHVIDYVRPAGQPPWQARNLGRMETVGLRLRGERQWRRAAVDGAFTWIAKDHVLDTGLESKYVFTQPTRQWTARLRHSLPWAASAEWQLVRRERRVPLDDYTVVDASLRRRVARGELVLRVSNVTDRRYEAVAGVPMPGRWLGLQARVDL